MRQLQIQQRHEKASSKKGQHRVIRILNAARDLLVEEGFSGLSMRKIAGRCGMTVGNLSYYYASKTDLLSDLIDAIIQGYAGWWDEVMADDSLTAEEQFVTILRFIMDDLVTPETTGFFPELWAIANHEAFARAAMDTVYKYEHDMLMEMIRRLNPALDEEDRVILAVHLQASVEGHTVFTGYDKKWTCYAPNMTHIVVKTFLELVKNITHDDIHGLSR